MLYYHISYTMDCYLKRVVTFIFVLLFSLGCTSKDLTYTLPEADEEDKWDASAYQRWIKGR